MRLAQTACRQGWMHRCMLFVLACLLSACGHVWQKPHVELAGIELRGGALRHQTLRLRLRIDNPNAVALRLEGFDFELWSQDAHLATGHLPEAVLVPAHAASDVELDAAIDLVAALRPVALALQGDGRLPYRLSGQASVQGGHVLPVAREGSIDLVRK